MQWFDGDEQKTEKFRKLMTELGEPNIMDDIEKLGTPTRHSVQTLLQRMKKLTREQLFELIGERKEDEPLFGIEAIRTDGLRLILNRFAPMQECALHDHGSLSADVLVLQPMAIQKYAVDESVPPDMQIPERLTGQGSLTRIKQRDIPYIATVEPEDIHSFRAMIDKNGPDATDIAIYYHENEKLGELVDWRSWNPASCTTCRSACASLS